jgi:membrane fusion protein, multidrug efflux system
VDTLHGAITVPVTAIDHGPNGLFLYAVQPNGAVQQQPVEVGYQDTNIAVVTKGVQAGANVVVSGQARLAPGTRVSTGNAPSSAPSDAGQSSGAGQGGSTPATKN